MSDHSARYEGTLASRYRDWRATPDGRLVFEAVHAAAVRIRARGFRHYGLGALWEAARYSYALRVGPDAEGWKLNDHHCAYMARELMEADPYLEDLFELRVLRSGGEAYTDDLR